MVGAAVLMGQAVKPPPAEELAKADADLIGTDGAAKIAALNTIHGWVKTGFVSDHVWRNWIPQLVKDDKQQDIAELALDGILHRPAPGTKPATTAAATKPKVDPNLP